MDNGTNLRPPEAVATQRAPETHAYHITHVVNVTQTPTGSVLKSAIDDANFGNPRDSLRYTDDLTEKISSDAGDDDVCRDDRWDGENRQRAITRHDGGAPIEIRSNRVCDEVGTDYRARYNSVAAKDTVVLPQHEITCEECARTRLSPVYTDRLIYSKEPLLAVEVVLCQRDDALCFKYRGPRNRSADDDGDDGDVFCSYHRDRMLVYSCVKTNAAGILYSRSWPRDVFNLRPLLKPSIRVIGRATRHRNTVANTQLYHRHANNRHATRISRSGPCAPMVFYRRESGVVADRAKRISWLNDSQDSLFHQARQQLTGYDRTDDHTGGHRSQSLLLLEPLLLMPEMPAGSTGRGGRNAKNQALRSERAKMIKILIAYAISFFILASITFYIVYFT